MVDRSVCPIGWTLTDRSVYYQAVTPSAARDRILDTAFRLFYARGIRAVGVDLIIAESGVAKATFYKHFPAKDELVVAYLDKVDVIWTGQLREAAEAAGPAPADQLVGLFDALGTACRREGYRGCAFINAAAEAAPGTPVHQRTVAHKRAVLAWLRELATRAGADDPDAWPGRWPCCSTAASRTAPSQRTPTSRPWPSGRQDSWSPPRRPAHPSWTRHGPPPRCEAGGPASTQPGCPGRPERPGRAPTDPEVIAMAVDTFMAFAGVYPDLEAAEADYELVKELHTRRGSWMPTTRR